MPPVKLKEKRDKNQHTKAVQSIDWFRQELPFVIAVLFLVHPCQTQTVTYISQRVESMATVFYLSAIYCYLNARISPEGTGKVVLFILTGASAVLGIMTKETAVTIPLMLLAVEWLLHPKKSDSKRVRFWFDHWGFGTEFIIDEVSTLEFKYIFSNDSF